MLFHPTRRRVLGALAAAGLVFDDAFAQPLAPTPQCHDGDEPTVRQTEGPYFKPSSPLRADLVEPNSKARQVELSGQVLTRRGRSSISGMPTNAASTTTPAFAIADTCSPMPRAATACAPSCRRSIPAAPATTTSRCRRRSRACSPRNSIFRTSR
jgi:hypothetical protein